MEENGEIEASVKAQKILGKLVNSLRPLLQYIQTQKINGILLFIVINGRI